MKRSFFSPSFLNLTFLLLIASGCNNPISLTHLDHPTQNLENVFEKGSFAQSYLNQIIEAPRVIEAAKKDLPMFSTTLTEENFAIFSKQAETWFSQIESELNRLKKISYSSSKIGSESRDNETLRAATIVSFVGLVYQREIVQNLVSSALPVFAMFEQPEVKDLPYIIAFKEKTLQKFMSLVGLREVLNQDIATTLKILEAFHQRHELKKSIAKSVNLFLISIIERDQSLNRSDLEMILTPEQLKNFDESSAQFNESFKEISTLYSADLHSRGIVNFLTVLGNLTWGAVNTAIGIGITVFAMIASPIVDGMGFPKFGFSENGKQITVDISGIFGRTYSGEMSMGLFEFQNNMSNESSHEGGHAVQSAVLGPLYLPTVVISYIIGAGRGHSAAFIESWADSWSGTASIRKRGADNRKISRAIRQWNRRNSRTRR